MVETVRNFRLELAKLTLELEGREDEPTVKPDFTRDLENLLHRMICHHDKIQKQYNKEYMVSYR